MTCQVLFMIKCLDQLGKNEFIAITGNSEELGGWTAANAVFMKQILEKKNVWEVAVNLKKGAIIQYRYLICSTVMVESSGEKVVTVNNCEVGLNPRTLEVQNSLSYSVDDGEFGFIAKTKNVDSGWLTHQHEVRFSISSPKNCPFLEPIDGQSKLNMETLYILPEACPCVIRSNLSIIEPYNCATIADKLQHKVKPPQTDEIHYTFIVETLDVRKLFIKLTVYDGSKNLGCGVLCYKSFATSKGIAKVPVLDEQQTPIAIMRIPYLHVKPFSSTLTVEKCFAKYWKPKPMVHAGHRGGGNSFTSKKLSIYLENSLYSFGQASKCGAHFIEFDVHLTKDGVPIVYHDLTTCLSAVKKGSNGVGQLVELPVHRLTLAELKSLKMSHKSRATTSRKLNFDEDDPLLSQQLFPTLEETFQQVPIRTGFNIEVKWPCLDEDCDYEDSLEHYFDANVFVDAILKVAFASAQSRKIIFSSFDVDICITLRRKQKRYPVLFLTNGDTRFYKPMLDLREATNKMAIGTCVAEGFLGLDTLDKDVYKTPDVVKKAHDAGLLFACYGDDVTDKLDVLQENAVDIAIYDRIYEKMKQV